MSQIIQTQKGKKKSSFIEFLKKECVLVIAVTLAILSSFISIPKLSYIDFKVLILLFNLMVVVTAFKELKVLDSIAIGLLKKCNTYTSISLALVFITFISSMIVTNDVALITFVPLSIVIARKANINVLKIEAKIFIIHNRINKVYAVDYIIERFNIKKLITSGDTEVDREFTSRGITILPKHSSFKHEKSIITEKSKIHATEEILDYIEEIIV